ncbi:hypothetical protein CSUI_009243 [Cystoisospora suis]|uniref:Uncharacterized protein n=1 Tax=Cystoisospora suis TaxID=483139 RepID=A0A2C6KKI7_9APIC|nr:hypothetical protein CSUI_009243 [Cystoisospora suis]
MAAQDPEELHQFRLWHRRLRRIDKELQETRSEAAKCAAEAWREGSFGCRFSAASEKEDETESEEMPHRQREAYRRGHGGRIDSGAEEREQKSSHPPIAEETDDGSKEEEERRKTQSERQRKEQRRENNAGEREEREETGRKPLATNEDGIEEAEQEETKKEEMLATRSYHEGGGEARGSMSERALKDSDRSKADSSFRGKFRGAPGQDEKKRTEKKRKREERCLSKENSVERDQQQEGSDYTCGTINEEEKKGTGISLEKMLPLLRSRRTSCNWAPDPRLCRAFGLPDPWSRMPFFDDRKYTAEELKVLLHQRDQLGRQGEMKVQAGSDSVTADTPESIPPSLPSGTSETHSEVGRSVSPPRAARAENHDSEVVGKKSIGGPQHPLVIQSGVITQEHEMPVKTKSSVIPPVKLFKAIFDADASGTSSDSSDEEESDKE